MAVSYGLFCRRDEVPQSARQGVHQPRYEFLNTLPGSRRRLRGSERFLRLLRSNFCAARLVILIVWIRQESVADLDYARPNTGASITR